MKALENLIRAFSVVLLPLNTFGGVVAGAWLVIIGEWWALGIGILIAIIGSFAIGLAMAPGLLLAGPAVIFQQKGVRSGFYLFSLLSVVYMFAVLSAWCLVVFFIFAHRTSEASAFPVLLWSYAIATGPIAYMAQREQSTGNDMSSLPAFFSQVAYFLSLVVVFLVARTTFAVVITFGAVMLIASIIQLSIGIISEHELESIEDT